MGQGPYSGGWSMWKATRKPPFNGVFFPTHHSNVEEEISPLFSEDFSQALGPIKFPFTNNTYPQCGLITLSCQQPDPKVGLGEEERPLQVSRIDDDAIQISDPLLKGLIDSKSCGFFSYVHPINTGSISYTISPNLTFFRCITGNPELANQIDNNFSVNYARYRGKGCPGYTVYFPYPNNTVPTPGRIPENCFLFEPPVVSSFKDQNHSDPFLLLTSNFSVEYHVSKECHVCRNHGGQCSRDAREFECLNERGTGISAGLGSTVSNYGWYCPRISDFGLAKLCPQKESIISLTGARGTAGYIAPEVFSRNFGGVSHKSDVYSYGMMVLEMVGGRKNISVEVDRTSEIYFPHWVYKRLKLDEELGLHGIMDDESHVSARKMIIVACGAYKLILHTDHQ
ncbi:hypothetical protein Vadar_033890 [Vaccinium darrowii]|uniref:Uncharacterized protein n=1 Tax=Vaccinium darrowii TaxID=229202 RepID=A0ACB7XM41_9ERIC|nr:hypothetical protein Vadar_033890 [Vaccinium darrowii]